MGMHLPNGKHNDMEYGTREKILSTAKELFANQGFKSTSMADIALQVGITKAALYYFFKNKEGLYGAIVHDALDVAYERLADAASHSHALSHMVETLIDVGISMGTAFRSIEPGALDRSTTSYAQIVQRFEDIRHLIVDCIRQNDLPNADIAAEVLLNAVHAYILHMQCGIPRIESRAYARYLAITLENTKHI